MAGLSDPVLGLTIDAPAGSAGALPQGGETTVEFPNNHFGYALTWFGFAITTPGPAGRPGSGGRELRPKAPILAKA